MQNALWVERVILPSSHTEIVILFSDICYLFLFDVTLDRLPTRPFVRYFIAVPLPMLVRATRGLWHSRAARAHRAKYASTEYARRAA